MAMTRELRRDPEERKKEKVAAALEKTLSQNRVAKTKDGRTIDLSMFLKKPKQ